MHVAFWEWLARQRSKVVAFEPLGCHRASCRNPSQEVPAGAVLRLGWWLADPVMGGTGYREAVSSEGGKSDHKAEFLTEWPSPL